MIILYWMSPEPIVVDEGASLLDAVTLMRTHRVRRLPVVRHGDELIGIVGRSDVHRQTGRRTLREPPDPARDEALRAVPVTDVMTPEPLTCDAGETVEQVCQRMIDEKVGAYPVLRRGHLVGIVSETDLLRALGELTLWRSGGRRITIRLPPENDPQQVYQLIDLAHRHQLELLALLTHRILDASAVLTTLRVHGAKADDFVTALRQRGFRVLDVQ